MADLSEIQASQSVKIAGANPSTGAEDNYADVDVNGNLLVKDYADGPVTPGTAAANSTLVGGQFNTVLPTLTNTQQSAAQVDSSARIIIAPLTNTSVIKAQLQDNAGNALESKGGELSVSDVIDDTAQYQAISVTTTAVEAKGAASRLTNRKIVIITPTNGTVYWASSNAVTSTTGTPIFKNTPVAVAFSDNVQVWLVTASGTVDVRVIEGA